MEGMGLKLTAVVQIMIRLLSPLSIFRPMVGTSWTHS